MTRARMFGSDVPFCDWMRRNTDYLPSYSATIGFVATDVDVFIHRYMSEVDSIGTREIQAIMMLEIKTRSGEPSESQLDTLCKINACRIRSAKEVKGKLVRHLGVSVVRMSGLTPDDSELLWGRFDETHRMKYMPIDCRTLLKLMRFDIHPDNFERQPFRRHHCTKSIVQVVTTPLGFQCEEMIVKSS